MLHCTGNETFGGNSHGKPACPVMKSKGRNNGLLQLAKLARVYHLTLRQRAVEIGGKWGDLRAGTRVMSHRDSSSSNSPKTMCIPCGHSGFAVDMTWVVGDLSQLPFIPAMPC